MCSWVAFALFPFFLRNRRRKTPLTEGDTYTSPATSVLALGFATRVCDLLGNPNPNASYLTKPKPCCVSYQQ